MILRHMSMLAMCGINVHMSPPPLKFLPPFLLPSARVDTQREGEGVRSVTPCSVRCHSPREGDGQVV